jgi:hypothetical protein
MSRVEIEFDDALNDAAWNLLDGVRKYQEPNAYLFNNLKVCLKEAIEEYLTALSQDGKYYLVRNDGVAYPSNDDPIVFEISDFVDSQSGVYMDGEHYSIQYCPLSFSSLSVNKARHGTFKPIRKVKL